MTSTFTGPVAHVGDLIGRDRWGRPLITPAGGGKAEPYTRVSTLAKVLDDKTALMQWKCRQTALGMGRRKDLVALAKTAKAEDKAKLNEIVESALAAAESDSAANMGTALHSMFEQVDAGMDPTEFGAEFAPDLTAYRDAMVGVEVLARELFVVCDELKAAGSFDKLVRVTLPDGRVVLMVADVKTGQHEPNYPHGVATQIAIYSRSHVYHPEKGRVASLPEMGVSQELGLLIHSPAGKATTDLYLLDLSVGWALATTAVAVKAAFKGKPITPLTPASA
jgi:hypothetical protein